MRFLTRTVWVLSLVSLLCDMCSEMLYPFMPLYLQSIGFGAPLIGLLEGIAEATAGLSKGYFGKLSDYRRSRLPFVQWGYFFSAIAKPLMALFTWPLWIVAARATDRLGKGLRTGARDAMLSDQTAPADRGKVFGFHRAMDTTGAVIGPLLALVYLYFYPTDYRTLFFIAFIPGLAGVLLTFLLSERKHDAAAEGKPPGFFSFLHYLRSSPRAYKLLIVALLAFALVSASDWFLLMMLKTRGITDGQMIALYIFYNLVYALLALPLGALADRIGLKNMLIIGVVLFAVAYGSMAVAVSLWHFWIIFGVYGVFRAANEGISKALISNVVHPAHVATAIGSYTALASVAALLASTLAGVVWATIGYQAPFVIGAAMSVVVAAYLLWVRIPLHAAS
jgi:MFS family permease